MKESKCKILIVGLGRIGRLVARELIENPHQNATLVGAVEVEANAELFSYLINNDSTYGRLTAPVTGKSGTLYVAANEQEIPLFTKLSDAVEECNPDIILECSGCDKIVEEIIENRDDWFNQTIIFSQNNDQLKTIKEVNTWIYGVNDSQILKQRSRLLINPGCLNNCLIPLLKCLDDTFQITQGTFLSVHSITNTQPSLDRPGKNLRWSRSSSQNLIPIAHDQPGLIYTMFPHLEDKFIGRTVRAPVPHTSYVTLSLELKHPASEEIVIRALSDSATATSILGIDQEPLVSSDYLTDPRSCVVDATSIRMIGNMTLFLSAWYNNEYAFAQRMLDMARASKLNHQN